MSQKIKTNCMNCGGAGRIEAYKHISNGTCFRCGGTGSESVAVEKDIASGKGVSKAVAKSFVYILPNGDFTLFTIYSDGSTNRGDLEKARTEVRAVIAAGGELIETTDNTRSV